MPASALHYYRNFPLWPALRWALLPLLFYLLGQFLEGPPYRVIVQSLPFIIGSFGIFLLAAQYLRERFNWPIIVTMSPALMLAAGYVYVIQQHFDGSANPPSTPMATLFSLLLFIAVLIYLRALAPSWRSSLRGVLSEPVVTQYDVQLDHDGSNDQRSSLKLQQQSNLRGVAMEPVVTQYVVKLYHVDSDGQRSSLKLEQQGHDDLPEALMIDGFSRTLSIDLESYWKEIVSQRLEHYQTPVSTYETIVKFGDTQQLVNDYELVFDVTFGHAE